jgi:hypothetical protein
MLEKGKSVINSTFQAFKTKKLIVFLQNGFFSDAPEVN